MAAGYLFTYLFSTTHSFIHSFIRHENCFSLGDFILHKVEQLTMEM